MNFFPWRLSCGSIISPMSDAQLLPTGFDMDEVGVVIVDHGSRRSESNDMLLQIVRRFADGPAGEVYRIIEPAHMELAEPSIATALDRCVARGARCVVVMPYFLLPGKHWHQDIPRLTQQAAARHPGVCYLVTAPMGLHPTIDQVIRARLDHCLAHAGGGAAACDVCQGSDKCRMKTVE